MNRVELASELAKARVKPSVYSLDGGLPNDAYCLDSLSGDRWIVYYSERGSRFDERVFTTEDEACRYLLGVLLDEPSARLPTNEGGG